MIICPGFAIKKIYPIFNQKIMEIKNVKNVYIQPAMSDSGLYIG